MSENRRKSGFNEKVIGDNNCFCEHELDRFLSEAKPYIEPIFNAIADVLIRIDEEGKYLDIVSKDDKKIVSSRKDIVGKNIDEFLPKKITEKIRKTIRKVIREKGSEIIEYDLSVPAGNLWFEATISWLKVKEAMVIIKDITERKETERKIHYLSYHDKLTDLYNRSYCEETLEELDREDNLPISVIMADVDGLKLVNDTYGHFFGDKMLKICSQTLKENCRINDIVCRWGGDEFLILLPKTSKEDTNKIYKRISSTNAYIENIPISMSLGLSTKENKNQEISEILRQAEDEMYDLKLCNSNRAKNSVIESLLTSLGEKSQETREHAYQMQKLAVKIAERIKLPITEIERLKCAILLHDIGQINIPQTILTKKSSLSEEEKRLIRKHPEFSYRIARSTDNFAFIAEDILSHHERWDGEGYPRGLKQEEITLLARIIAIVDAYDVMKSGRCYQKAKTEEEIRKEFRTLSGKQFDPNLVELFFTILKEKKFY